MNLKRSLCLTAQRLHAVLYTYVLSDRMALLMSILTIEVLFMQFKNKFCAMSSAIELRATIIIKNYTIEDTVIIAA